MVLPALSYVHRKEPIQRAALISDYGLCIKLYGYYTAILANWIFTDAVPSREQLHGEFLAAQEPVERGRCVGDAVTRSVLVIQVESLDYEIVNAELEQQPVAPFLDRLKTRSHFMRIDPHYTRVSSSSGADFQLLTGNLPHPTFPVYRLADVNYAEALPQLFAQRGIDSLAFVGVTPNLFAQGAGFKRAGFRRHYAQRDYPQTRSRWGIDDESFLDFNSAVINGRSTQSFYLMITIGSHGPFDFVEHEVFSVPGILGRYANTINHVDGQLSAFLAGVRGSYLVVIYGDHAASVTTPEYSSAIDGVGYVPGFIFLLDDGEASKPRFVDAPPQGSANPTIASFYWLLRNSAIEGCKDRE